MKFPLVRITYIVALSFVLIAVGGCATSGTKNYSGADAENLKMQIAGTYGTIVPEGESSNQCDVAVILYLSPDGHGYVKMKAYGHAGPLFGHEYTTDVDRDLAWKLTGADQISVSCTSLKRSNHYLNGYPGLLLYSSGNPLLYNVSENGDLTDSDNSTITKLSNVEDSGKFDQVAELATEQHKQRMVGVSDVRQFFTDMVTVAAGAASQYNGGTQSRLESLKTSPSLKLPETAKLRNVPPAPAAAGVRAVKVSGPPSRAGQQQNLNTKAGATANQANHTAGTADTHTPGARTADTHANNTHTNNTTQARAAAPNRANPAQKYSRANNYGGRWTAGNNHPDWNKRHAYLWKGHHYRWYDGGWLIVDGGFWPVPVSTEDGGSPMLNAQGKLAKLGYYSGPVDGTPSPDTRQAIINYQTDNKLPATGALDDPTLQSLGLE